MSEEHKPPFLCGNGKYSCTTIILLFTVFLRCFSPSRFWNVKLGFPLFTSQVFSIYLPPISAHFGRESTGFSDPRGSVMARVLNKTVFYLDFCQGFCFAEKVFLCFMCFSRCPLFSWFFCGFFFWKVWIFFKVSAWKCQTVMTSVYHFEEVWGGRNMWGVADCFFSTFLFSSPF